MMTILGKRVHYTQLVGMCTGSPTVEIDMEFPQKLLYNSSIPSRMQ